MTEEEKSDTLINFINDLYDYYKIGAKLETSKEETVRMFNKMLVDIKFNLQLTDLIWIHLYISRDHVQVTLKYQLEDRYRPLPPISLKDLNLKVFHNLLETYTLRKSKKLYNSYKRKIAGLEVMLDLVQGT